ncbi:MAG: MFS transporter [Conexivisphaerales archaeon]
MNEQVYDSSYARKTLILFATFAIFVMYVESMLTPSLPVIADEFGVTASQVSLILSVYMVTGVALNPIIGKLGDIYGKKRIFTYVLIIYATAVTFSGFAPNFETLVITRTVQGIGLTMFPLAMSLVREEFPREMIPRAQAVLSGMFGAGFAIGLPLGAYLSNDFGWRTTYHTALPFAILFAVLISSRVRESRYRRPDAILDYKGAAVLGGSLAMIVLALSEGPSWGWYSPAVDGLLAIGLILLIPLVLFERRQKEPILDFKLLATKNVLVTNMVILVSGLGMFLAFQTIVYKLELPSPVGFNYDVLRTGLSLAPVALIMMFVAPAMGILISKTGVKPVALFGTVVGAAGFLLCSLSSTASQLFIGMIIFSIGLGSMMVSTINLLVLTVDPREMGLATSMNTVFRTLGSSLGAPIAGSLISSFSAYYMAGMLHGKPFFFSAPSNIAFQYSFYIAALLFLISGFIVLTADEVLGRVAVRNGITNSKDSNALNKPEAI